MPRNRVPEIAAKKARAAMTEGLMSPTWWSRHRAGDEPLTLRTARRRTCPR